MALFDKLRDPVILKEDSEAATQLQQLSDYLNTAPADIRPQVEQDIKLTQLGIKGEENLMFELKNSHLPMYVMHDLFFERDGLTTQIDYLVVTRKLVIVIECKNLYGEIDIDNQGNFTRKVQLGNRYVKKGIYSPVTQNQRHLDMIHEICRESIPLLRRGGFDKYFDDYYKSVIVLANSSSVLNMRYAPADIKDKVIKADRLISYIKEMEETSDNSKLTDKKMKELADFFLEKSVKNTKDYTEKYKKDIIPTEEAAASVSSAPDTTPVVQPATEVPAPVQPTADAPAAVPADLESTPVYQALKSYRYNKSREENIKPYFIYNNAQLEEIIRKDPTDILQLKKISGFGDVKCEKYGADILKILADHR